MHEQVLKTGEGRIDGVSSGTAQPGKALTITDGTITLCTLQLDTAFPDREVTIDGVVNILPGIVLDLQFATDLRIKTDGANLTFYWQ